MDMKCRDSKSKGLWNPHQNLELGRCKTGWIVRVSALPGGQLSLRGCNSLPNKVTLILCTDSLFLSPVCLHHLTSPSLIEASSWHCVDKKGGIWIWWNQRQSNFYYLRNPIWNRVCSASLRRSGANPLCISRLCKDILFINFSRRAARHWDNIWLLQFYRDWGAGEAAFKTTKGKGARGRRMSTAPRWLGISSDLCRWKCE